MSVSRPAEYLCPRSPSHPILRRHFILSCLSAAGYSLFAADATARQANALSVSSGQSADHARLTPQEVVRRIAALVLSDTRDRNYETDIQLEALMSVDDATNGRDYLPIAQSVLRERESRGVGRPEFWREPYTSLAFEVFERDGDRTRLEHFIAESRRALAECVRSHDGIVLIYNDDVVRAYPEVLKSIRRDWEPVFLDNVQEYAGRMAKTGWLISDSAFSRDATDQLTRLRGALRQPETGLYAHGRGFFHSRDTVTRVNWGRGQAWVLRGLVETLSYLPATSHEAQQVSDILREFGDSLLRYQDSEGFWHQVMDRNDSYQESSCTGMISYYLARAVRQGFLPNQRFERSSRRAFRALMRKKIAADGTVYGGSQRTRPQRTMADYLTRPAPLNDPHGVAGCIFAASGHLLLTAKTSTPWSPFRAGSREANFRDDAVHKKNVCAAAGDSFGDSYGDFRGSSGTELFSESVSC